MPFNFDQLPDRRTDSNKWTRYPPDVLPLWVADMDFRAPQPIIDALRERVEHGVFGYGYEAGAEALRAIVHERLAALYGWQVEAEHILPVPGLVSAFNLAARTIGAPGDGVLILSPVYFPFFSAVDHARRQQHVSTLVVVQTNGHLRYEIDFDALEAAITPRTRLFLLCNPHNPVGRVFTRAELEQLAELCLRHDLVICSDEIHCDLVFDGQHTPIATLSPEVAARTITLQAASKTYNLAGLSCGYLVAQNADMMAQLVDVAERLMPRVSVMGFGGTIAALRHGQPWLDALLPYLRANRDAVVDFAADHLPGLQTTCPEGTYLAWLDCRTLDLPEPPFDFFLNEAKVALSNGADFGPGGEGFVRLNFACPRSMLMEGLERMRAALGKMAS